MHTSTSPQYAIIASCDVAAAMMEPPGGTALVEESILEAIDFRRAMRKVDDEFGKDWWFKVWGPERLAAGRHRQPRRLDAARERALARLRRSRAGLQHARPDQGDHHHARARCDGQVREDRHSRDHRDALSRRARHHRGEDGPLLVLHHVHDRHHQRPLEYARDRACSSSRTTTTTISRCGACCRSSCQAFPRYEKIGLRDLCDQIHGVYKANDVARVTTEMYLSDMVPAMKPADAWARMAHGEIDRIDIDQLEGRITSVLLTPYPPGIPLLIPGERFNPDDRGLSAVRAGFQQPVSRLRDRHPRPG